MAGPGASRGVQGSPGGVQGGSRGWFNNRYIQNFIFLNFGQVSGLPAPGRGRDPGAQTAVRAKHGSDCNGLGRERHHPTQNLFSRLWSAPWPGAPNISRKRYFPGWQGPGAQGHGPGDRGPGPARGTRGPGSGPPNISRKRYFALWGHPIDAPGLGARAPNNPGPTRSTRPGGGGGGSCRGVPRDDDIARRHIYMFIKTARPIQETN